MPRAAWRTARASLIEALHAHGWRFVRGWGPPPWAALDELLPEWRVVGCHVDVAWDARTPKGTPHYKYTPLGGPEAPADSPRSTPRSTPRQRQLKRRAVSRLGPASAGRAQIGWYADLAEIWPGRPNSPCLLLHAQVWCLSNCAPPPERTRCRLLDADGLLDAANNNNNNNNNNNAAGADAQRGRTRLGLAPWSDYVAGLGRWRAWNVSRCGRYRGAAARPKGRAGRSAGVRPSAAE